MTSQIKNVEIEDWRVLMDCDRRAKTVSYNKCQGFLKLKRNDIQEARYLPLRFGGTFTGIGNVSDLTIEMGNCSDGKKKDAMNVGMSRNRIENFDGPCVWMLKSLRMMRALC